MARRVKPVVRGRRLLPGDLVSCTPNFIVVEIDHLGGTFTGQALRDLPDLNLHDGDLHECNLNNDDWVVFPNEG